jgi:hypothetical protein
MSDNPNSPDYTFIIAHNLSLLLQSLNITRRLNAVTCTGVRNVLSFSLNEKSMGGECARRHYRGVGT